MLINKRTSDRFEFFIIVDFKPVKDQPGSYLGITRDLSKEGFSFESRDFKLEPGETLEFKFKQPQSDLMVSLQGEIVWKERYDKLQCYTGVKFREADEDSIQKIMEIVSAAREAAYDFCHDYKSEIISEDNSAGLKDVQKVELIPEKPVKEDENVCLEKTLNYNLTENNMPAKPAVEPKTEQKVKRETGKIKKISFFVLPAALAIGVALLIVFKEYKSENPVPALTKPLSNQGPGKELPIPSKDDLQLDNAAGDAEQLQPQLIEEETDLLTEKKEVSDLNSTAAEETTRPEISKKQPLLFAEDLLNDKLAIQKPVNTDQQQSVPEKETKEIKKEKTADLKQLPPEEQDNKEKYESNMQAAMVPDTAAEKEHETTIEKEQPRTAPVSSKDKDVKINKEEADSSGPPVRKKTTVKNDTAVELSSRKPVIDTPVKKERKVQLPALAVTKTDGKIKTQSKSDVAVIRQDHKEIQTGETNRPQEMKKEKIVVFQELFDNDTSDWDVFNTSAASAHIRGGEYKFENKRRKGPHFTFLHHDFPHGRDFLIKVDVKAAKTIYSHSYGFVFGAKDIYNNYVFRIINNQYFLIGKYHNGVLQDLAGGIIKKGIINKWSFNTLKIERSANIIRFYINSKYIDKIRNASFQGGRIGFVVEGKLKVSLDKLYSQYFTVE